MQAEIERFNEGLSRCVLGCQDDAKDKIGPNSGDADIEKARKEFEVCAIKCCDKNIEKLPSISKRVEETLKSGRY